MKKKRKYTRRNGVTSPAAEQKAFDLKSLVPEDGIVLAPRRQETVEMFDKLNELKVGQSYRMPIDLLRIYHNAKTSHRKLTKKKFIHRKLDSYNFRVWRIEDDAVLRMSQHVRKNK
jgi:hypothetical protein